MRAILVCVDYADILRITLPYNLHHFEQVMVVTSYHDPATERVVWDNTKEDRERVKLHVTDAFYEGGAIFNKWKALEEGLDIFGRYGWMCLMDADVMWPKDLQWREGNDTFGPMMGVSNPSSGGYASWPKGHLVTPVRRMWDTFPHNPLPIRYIDMMFDDVDSEVRVPGEQRWNELRLHPQQREFAGYSQIFHADDPVLKECGNCGWGAKSHIGATCESRPCKRFAWHQTDWRHAGGADSFFQARWSDAYKTRPPFEVLHLGPAGVNWCGRASTYADGSFPQEGPARHEQVMKFLDARRGKMGDRRHDHEKITPP